MKAKICILTDPMPVGRYFVSERIKRLIRHLKRRAFPKNMSAATSGYRGHPAVTRSLVEGLTKIGCAFKYNPRYIKDIGGTAIVLSGVNTLRQAIELKRRGFIDKLVAGPNIVTFSDDFDGILGSPEIDVCITPSQVVCDLYEKYCPSLTGRCQPWPAGVDVDYWRPTYVAKKDVGLIYIKKEVPLALIDECKLILEAFDLQCAILRYGEYSLKDYRAVLDNAALVIGFSGSESQGLAWAEAWSMNVPTFICKVDSSVFNGREYKCSSSPYLNGANGAFFSTTSELESLIEMGMRGMSSYFPREWVKDNMSDQVSARRLLEITE